VLRQVGLHPQRVAARHAFACRQAHVTQFAYQHSNSTSAPVPESLVAAVQMAAAPWRTDVQPLCGPGRCGVQHGDHAMVADGGRLRHALRVARHHQERAVLAPVVVELRRAAATAFLSLA